ncbi:hypothetical protein SLEP1_g57407 [Rubroshorea leprosula]|uniref:Uncharacterized protein n=1 Tax=Rubroshorea leprosula TaxID=152421 RepID=A0AAV5MLH3_9ROSI|nr:hypothetical protein SLEP1_g57407 [Rubroshorea leprosula]
MEVIVRSVMRWRKIYWRWRSKEVMVEIGSPEGRRIGTRGVFFVCRPPFRLVFFSTQQQPTPSLQLLYPIAGLSPRNFFLFSTQQSAFLHARSASSSSPSSRPFSVPNSWPLSMQVLLVLRPIADLSPCKICFFFFAEQLAWPLSVQDLLVLCSTTGRARSSSSPRNSSPPNP